MAVHMHHITEHTQQPLASTWLGDHQGRPSAPQIRPSRRPTMERQQDYDYDYEYCVNQAAILQSSMVRLL